MKCIEIDGRTHALEDLKYDEARGGVVCPVCGALLKVGEPIGHDLHDGVDGYEIDAWPYYCENCGGEFYSEDEV